MEGFWGFGPQNPKTPIKQFNLIIQIYLLKYGFWNILIIELKWYRRSWEWDTAHVDQNFKCSLSLGEYHISRKQKLKELETLQTSVLRKRANLCPSEHVPAEILQREILWCDDIFQRIYPNASLPNLYFIRKLNGVHQAPAHRGPGRRVGWYISHFPEVAKALNSCD